MPAQEAEALRRQIAMPAPEGADRDKLVRHYVAGITAAQRLGDQAARRALLQEAIRRLPEMPRWYNDLAFMLQREGQWGESRRHFEMALERERDPASRLFIEGNLLQLRVLRSEPDAESALRSLRERATAALQALSSAPTTQRFVLQRTLSGVARSEGTLWERRSRFAEQLQAAEAFERHAREAMETRRQLPGVGGFGGVGEVASAQKARAAALRALERDAEAEQVLQEHVEFIQAQRVGADFAVGAHSALGAQRLIQRDFAAAERQFRLSLEAVNQLGEPAASTLRADRLADLARVLWAQGKYAEAQAEWDRFDHAAGPEAARFKRRNLNSRGLVLLGAGRAAEAAELLAELVKVRQREYGPGHFQTALVQGLHGAALWAQQGNAAAQEQGAELLKQAVLDLHAPRNADQLNDRGLRRPLRELIHHAYLQAMTSRGGLPALWALGVADQLRGGVTAQAMADAAVRAAASDPDLAALVRQEQDARRELQGIEAQLRPEDGPTNLPAEVAAQLRARVAEVETLRTQLQQRIRDRYPGYDRIVRPPLADPAAVAQRLSRGEAFLMFVPQERALLAWLITPEELPYFVRLDVGAAELHQLVGRVRRTLDFSSGRAPPFDHAAAQLLHRHLIAPFEGRLGGQQTLVIAASGPLATLPFAALRGPGSAASPTAPWIPQRWALAQVPSVAAWLALRQLAAAQPAPEPLLGFGDPSFARGGPPRGTAVGRAAPVLASRATGAPAMRYDQLPPLPETRDELHAIAKALQADATRDLHLGAAATRAGLLEASRSGVLARKRVVVFATHGLMAGDLPGLAQPALAMAPPPEGPADDLSRNLVTLTDVLGLKMNADWVVLSACNTAAGDGRGEEALSGLARGFFYAGSRSLLVTQWAVETESAKRLTTALFAHHASTPTSSKAQSLRHAMLQVMAEPAYAHPAFWAPYMLVGDGAR